MTKERRNPQGRPPATTHALIEAAAFSLFADKGFDATGVDDIAGAVGIARRTLFRYYASKNDIPWGQFDASLGRFEKHLDATPSDFPVGEAIKQAVIEFNRVEPEAVAQHRQRMRLILSTPALQAHSVLRYQEWRSVIARYVARRFALSPDDLLPRTVGHVSLALALSAYEQWLADSDERLEELLSRSFSVITDYMCGDSFAAQPQSTSGKRRNGASPR